MNKYGVIVILLLTCLMMMNCEESAENVIGSRDHDIQSAYATEPQILADGASTTEIVAHVRDKDGYVAPNMRVHFETTMGNIEEYAITNYSGDAVVTLMSVASDTDLVAEVTAIVLDTSFSTLAKNGTNQYKVKLSVPGFETQPLKIKSVKKAAAGQDYRATIQVKFLGVSLQTEIENPVLPADGVSESKVEIRLRETTSLKAIKDAEIYFLLIHGTITSSTKTNDQGNSEVYLKAAKKAVDDTLVIIYGNAITRRIPIKYVMPKFELNPQKAHLPADGISKVQMIATLLTQQNTPITGARIKFSTTAGVIFESALTDNYGEAKVDLIAGRQPDSSVQVIAKFLSLSDTAIISFGSINVSSITINADSEPLLRNGNTSKQLNLVAKNLLGLPVANTVINLTTNIGNVTETTVTDQQGNATFEYLSDAGSSDTTATIIASVGTVQAMNTVQLLGVTMNITANPASILADGKSTSIIRVEVKQTSSHVAVPNQSLNFAVDRGTIPITATTNNQGVITTTYTAGNIPGIATITVIYGSLIRDVKVSLLTNYPTNITLNTDLEPILRDGVASKQLNLQATNEQGQPIENVAINIATNLGSVPASVITDQQGFASIKYTADAGSSDVTATITASVGTVQAIHAVQLLGVTMNITANPASILADGKSTATIQVEVKQTSSHVAVPNQSLNFAADRGTIPIAATTDNQGLATATYTASTIPGIATITVIYGSLVEEVKISLLTNYPANITLNTDLEPILRDGVASKQLSLNATNELGQPIENVTINIATNLGSVPASVITDQQGFASIKYTADAGSSDATAKITASAGTVQATQTISLLGINILMTAIPDSIAADGKSTASVRVVVKQTTSNIAISNYVLGFATDNGTIPATATTDNQGLATTIFTSSLQPGIANITVTCGTLKQSVGVYLSSSLPSSIILGADPNFIWVKETGNIDQTIISATVLGVNNQPLGNDIKVKFFIINSPGGGESIEPSSGNPWESNIVPTVNGVAQTIIRSGTKSGTIQTKAELVDFPNIVSQTTNIVIRSGPPYMWVDPNNANNVIPHATLAVESGKHNVCFTNPIQDIHVTAYFADIYNNPIEDGTAVYFTTTGGYITSDAVTNDKGQTSVILQNVNPFPYLVSNDPNQLTSLRVPNPNDDTLMINVELPDFEGSEVLNSIGTYKENDGIAVILAYTWGKDQNGNHIKVWTIGRVIYSVGVKRFTAVSDRDSLGVGQTATIYIRLYDGHGNPVAAGSRLIVSTNAGELSDANLLPAADRYGFGTTYFMVTLTNTLKPGEDEETTAVVKIELDSPNGTGKIAIPIYLKITP